MSDDIEQPKIFAFIDTKISGVYSRLDVMSKEFNEKLFELAKTIAVIDSKDKPSPPCREFIAKFEGECEQKCKQSKLDNDALGKKVEDNDKAITAKVSGKVGFKFFWGTVISIGTIIIAGFLILSDKIDAVKDMIIANEPNRHNNQMENKK